ncbi:hypothetical protein E1211_15335 [Micromonospora sp. 15K316]|uniref:hypothetical protein n=1 Tax=Micromonospora sp. 15K316 TaxID=2530376 RepID=UPI00104BFC46|nr:hypothetical protein [Micromonospora sp. 15K316]TDC35677.1 hypothetical protein E1211_15335 [Micromonospora sp. 15K316]
MSAVEMADAGPCNWCGCNQWDHRNGRKGCKTVGCGCGKYEQPPALVVTMVPADDPVVADPVAQAAYVEQVAAIDEQLAESDDDRRPCHRCSDLVLTLSSDGLCDGCVAEDAETGRLRADVERLTVQLEQAYERVDELETDLGRIYGALHIDRDRDAAEVIEDRRVRLRDAESDLLAVRGILLPNGYPSRIPADIEMVPAVAPAVQWLADRVDELTAELERQAGADLERRRKDLEHVQRLAAERDQAVGEAEEAQRRAERLGGELDAATATIGRLSRDLAHANAGWTRARQSLNEAIRKGTESATRVIRKYDADECETCGYRTTVPIDHEHPLTPVTVLIVRREVPGA